MDFLNARGQTRACDRLYQGMENNAEGQSLMQIAGMQIKTKFLIGLKVPN
jgi:hypothetical protein